MRSLGALLMLAVLMCGSGRANEAPGWQSQLEGPLGRASELGQQALAWQQQQAKMRGREQDAVTELQLVRFQIAQQQRYLQTLQRQSDALRRQIDTAGQLSRDLEPQLELWYARLERQLYQDLPFRQQERGRRLTFLRQALDSVEVPVAERFRRFSEALGIEVAQGHEQQLSRTTAEVEGQTVALTTLRLGRIGWLGLTQDQRRACRYDGVSQQWQWLAEESVAEVARAVAVADNRQLAQWVALPLSLPAPRSGGEGRP